MTDTATRPVHTDPQLQNEDPIHTHIIAPDENHTAQELVMEARIEGTPLTALCGYVWVPSRDPKNYPVCSMCAEILKEVGFNPDKVEP